MALNFPNRKLIAFISANNGKYTTIHRSTYMDLKYQLLLDQNFLGLYLIKKTLFHTPYKILESEMFKSIKPFKSVISHKLGSGQNNSSSPVIRSKLDYGSIVYGSAGKSYLQMLDTVHNQPLGIKLSALSRPWGLNSHWERC